MCAGIPDLPIHVSWYIMRCIKDIPRSVRTMFELQFQGMTNSYCVLQRRKDIWISISDVWVCEG